MAVISVPVHLEWRALELMETVHVSFIITNRSKRNGGQMTFDVQFIVRFTD